MCVTCDFIHRTELASAFSHHWLVEQSRNRDHNTSRYKVTSRYNVTPSLVPAHLPLSLPPTQSSHPILLTPHQNSHTKKSLSPNPHKYPQPLPHLPHPPKTVPGLFTSLHQFPPTCHLLPPPTPPPPITCVALSLIFFSNGRCWGPRSLMLLMSLR
jgi:hypothetical protein